MENVMIKFVVFFKLREGVDQDEFWKFWEEVYAPPHMVPGLIRYCINRFTQVDEGETQYWGMAEQWFESKEAYEKMFESPELIRLWDDLKRSPGCGFIDRISDPVVVWMEEKTIVDNGQLLKANT